MTRLKMCGIRRIEDVEYVNYCAPDYAGFILSAGFKRSVPPGEYFAGLESSLDDGIKRVGVLVNEPLENIEWLFPLLDVLQLHGDEDGEYINLVRQKYPHLEVWKAVRLRSPEDIKKAPPADKYVFDAFSEKAVGGTGKRIDEEILSKAVSLTEKPFFIAGGINAENAGEIIKKFSPYGIDISGGIETDGVKDLSKMKSVIKAMERNFNDEYKC